MAETIARVFPDRMQFVREVISEGIEPASSFPAGPYTTDQLQRREKDVVEFETPANKTGLGTQSRLAANSSPIHGVAILFGEEPNLVQLMLIGCVNLANLQLARTTAAMRETAVRAAPGANGMQLVMARLTESLVLAAVGGVAGMALAFAGVRLLLSLVPANVPRLEEVQVNWLVLLFAAGLSTSSAILFGILPALRSLRVPPQSVLQSNSSRTANTREGRRTRSLLVAAEVACTVVLLIVTALVLRSFSRLLRQDRGFDSSHVTAAQVDLFAPQYGDHVPHIKAVKLAFADRALAALAQLPGVRSAAITSVMPLTGETWVDELGRPDHPVPPAQKPPINVRWVNADYLATMQIPLLKGRNHPPPTAPILMWL